MLDDPDGERGDPPATPGGTTLQGRDALAPTEVGGTATPTQDTLVPASRRTPPEVWLPDAGYQIGELIGRGGMGEVMVARDHRIGREVAIKRMRTPTPDGEQLARFLREARIQARLDHPAIVPVHELGTDAHGRPYFTMKRVSGRTLADRLAEGAPLQRLLRAFVDVCLAIDLAHSRAVIHRDLKPANIMLGDYGEVYVLDWGVARVVTDDPGEPASDIPTLDGATQTGAMLGTPGYMAPEQINGEPASEAADVYALGAILFEILAGEPLHPRGQAALASTLSRPQDAPARRRADRGVPPELDAICVAALAEAAAARPSARQLGDQVQAYLDGDRDHARRRRLAAEQLALAHAALTDGAPDARATAIRRAGRALALDPESTEAAELVSSLIVKPPDALPPELIAELEREDRRVTSQRTTAGYRAYLALFLFWLVIPFTGVKNWAWLIALYAVIGGLAAVTWRAARTGRFNLAASLVGNFVLAILWTRIAGIFLLTPVLLCGVLLGLTTTQWLIERRWVVFTWTTGAFVVPMLLEELGVLESSWQVTQTAIISHSSIFAMEGAVANSSLLLANVVFVSLFGLVGIRLHRVAKEAKRKLHVQAWHLSQLVPRRPAAETHSLGAERLRARSA